MCDFGQRNPSLTIVLVGDSHADHWSTPLIAMAREHNMRLITLMKGACPFADIEPYNVRVRRALSECVTWRQRAFAKIANIKPDIVIISQFSSAMINGHFSSVRGKSVTREAWAEAQRRSLLKINNIGTLIAVLRDTPTSNVDLSFCVERAMWSGGPTTRCNILRRDALENELAVIERKIVSQIPRARYIDMSDQFCGPTLCLGTIDNVMVYKDSNHLTTQFAAKLKSPLYDSLFPAGHRN